MRKRLPRYYFDTNWTNTRKAAKETTSRPSKNKNLFGTLVKGILFIDFLIESWFEDSLERPNAESRICLVELKLYRMGILWYVFLPFEDWCFWIWKCLIFLYNKTIANRTVRSCSTRWAYACATRFYFLNWNGKPKNIHGSRHIHSTRLFFENAISLLSCMHEWV